MLELNERLIFYREKAKKSQKDVEREVGIPQTTLCGWEKGKCEPGASNLVKLAKCYKVSALRLLYDEPPGSKRKTAI